jgi:hypothetical protein
MIIVGMSGIKLRNRYRIYRISMSSNYMIGSLFICLSLTQTLANGDSPKSTSINNTGGYTSDRQQSIRTITIRRNGNNGQNLNNLNNFTKFNKQKEMNLESGRVDSDPSEWSLQFDPNYFASLNAANHRPIDLKSASASESKTKVSSSSSSSSDNMYYYTPETYGKTTHKNHKTSSYTYSYPSTSTTTSTTPTPNTSNNRYGDYSTGTTSNGYSEPAPQSFSTPYDSTDTKNGKHPTMNYNYEESSEEVEEPNYYDGNEEIGRKYYYPMRYKSKPYSLQDYSDLSSLPTSNDKSKVQTAVDSPVSPPVADYGPQEETPEYIDSNYGTSGNVKFPSKYGSGAYYPSYYPSSYYSHSGEHGGDSLSSSKSSWLGPGIAGLLLGILPLGILMASMVPAFMSVPIVSTATVGRRKRQSQDSDVFNMNSTNFFLNPGVINIIAKYGMSSLDDSKCLQEMFCTLTVEGKKKNTNIIQNLIYKVIEWLVLV